MKYLMTFSVEFETGAELPILSIEGTMKDVEDFLDSFIDLPKDVAEDKAFVMFSVEKLET